MNKILALIFIALLFTACSDDSDSNGVQPINKVLNRQATGSSANNLLSDDTFTSMIIELVYIEGFEPTQQAIDNFTAFLWKGFSWNGLKGSIT